MSQESADAVTPPYAQTGVQDEHDDKKENIPSDPKGKNDDDRWEFHAAKFRDFTALDNTMNQTSATDFFNNTNGLGSPEFYAERRRKELAEEQEKTKRRRSYEAPTARSRLRAAASSSSTTQRAPAVRGVTPTRTSKPLAVPPPQPVVRKPSIVKADVKPPVPVATQKPITRSMTQEARRRGSFMAPTEVSRRRSSEVAPVARPAPKAGAKPAVKPVVLVPPRDRPAASSSTRAPKPPVVPPLAVVKRPPPVNAKPKPPVVRSPNVEKAVANPPANAQPVARVVRERRSSFMAPTQASRRRSVIPAPVAKETKPKNKI